jgi:hypothetical protein
MEQYINYAKHISANEEVLKWVKSTLKTKLSKEEKSTEEVEHILDFLCQSNLKIARMSYDQAHEKTIKWNDNLQKKGLGVIELDTDIETVLDFKDGFKIVKLIGENSYKREGMLMRHCVASYFGKNVEVYSLRDKNNLPHATMEKDQQIKGKGNGDIHPKYVDYIVKFLEHTGMTVGDSEMKHLGYVNLEKLFSDLEIEVSEETNKLLYQGKYYPISKGIDNLIDKNGKKIRTLELLDYFPMFNEEETETGFSLKLAINIPTLASGFVEFIKNKTSKRTLLNELTGSDNTGSGCYKDYATVSAGYNATVSAGNNATVSAGYNAKVSAGNNAKVSAKDYATVSAGNNATVSAGYNAKVSAGNNATVSAKDYATVSAGYNAKVSAEDYAKVSAGNNATVSAGNNATVSAGYNAKVSAGYNAKVSAEDYAKVSAGKNSILISETDSKLSGKLGTILLITKRDCVNGEYKITDWKAEMIDGKKIKEDTWYKLENGKLVEINNN